MLNQGKDVVLILLYMDDLLIIGNNDEIIQECISKLKATFEMIDLSIALLSWDASVPIQRLYLS